MNSCTTKRFRTCFSQLPPEVQRQAQEAYRRWVGNPAHPGLRLKQVHPTQPVYSVRITLDYRALGLRNGDTMIWFWIGSHTEYVRLLSSM